MMRLLKIELLKVLSYKAFWIMIGFYTLVLALMIFGIPGLIDYVAEKSGNVTQFRIVKAIVFNFPDIWQNVSFVAGMRYFIKIILGIIVIILITTEYQFQTTRANIINGNSRTDFLFGKIEMILLLSFFSMLVIFLSGLYLGLTNSASISMHTIFSKMIFLPAYFLELSSYLIFCLMLGILFKKTGIAFIAHFIYFIIEPILDYKLNDKLAEFLPLNVINHVIKSPNTSLIKVSTSDFNFDFQEFISVYDVGLCLLYTGIFILISWLLLTRRDF